jgi:hypothetical protein
MNDDNAFDFQIGNLYLDGVLCQRHSKWRRSAEPAGAPMLTFLDIQDTRGVTARLRAEHAPLTPPFGTSSGGERRA